MYEMCLTVSGRIILLMLALIGLCLVLVADAIEAEQEKNNQDYRKDDQDGRD